MCMATTLSSDLLEVVTTIRKTSKELNEKMSIIDKTICDLQHEIEFGKFDVCRGYKKFRQLQDILIERRKIKDELELLHPLIAYVGTIESSVSKVHTTVINKENSFKNRKYTPRILKGELNAS